MDQSSTQPPPDVDVGAGLVVVAWVLGAIGVLLLAMRMYARAFIIKKFGWDDWTMVLAVALALATNITVTLMVHYGVGRHAAYLNPGQLSNALYMVWLTIALSTASAAIGKISIALLLIRLINRSRWRDTFLWTLISLLIVVNALLIIVIFVQCTPVIKLWDPTVPGACWSPTIQLDIWYFQGAFSALSDLILALFPLPIIWKLQIPLLSKAVLGFLMSLGVNTAAITAVKTASFPRVGSPDFTWDTVPLVYWLFAEPWVVSICACVPTVKAVAVSQWKRLARFAASVGSKRLAARAKRDNHQPRHLSDDNIQSGASYSLESFQPLHDSKGQSQESHYQPGYQHDGNESFYSYNLNNHFAEAQA